MIALVISSAAQAHPMLDAAAIGAVDEVRQHLEQGADVNVTDDDRFSSLHWAAFGGYTEMVEILIDQGATIDLQNDDSLTPLHTAVLAGHANIVKQLLAFGADPDITTRDGNTARDMAQIRGRNSLLALFDEQPRLARHKPRKSPRAAPRPSVKPAGHAVPPAKPATSDVTVVASASQTTSDSARAGQTQKIKSTAQSSPVTAPQAQQSTPPIGKFAIQLAAFRSKSEAQHKWLQFQQSFPTLLGQSQLLLQEVEIAKRGTFFRVRTGPFTNRTQATTLCGQLKTKRQDCMVVSLNR